MDETPNEFVAKLITEVDTLRQEKSRLQAEYESRIGEVVRDIDAYERVIARQTGAPLPIPIVPRGTSLTMPLSQSVDKQGQPSRVLGGSGWARRLRGMTQQDALIEIAEANNGIIRVIEAKRIMIDAGMIKGKVSNAASHMYHTLSRSPRFERIAPGEFRLLSDSTLQAPLEVEKKEENHIVEVTDSFPTRQD